MASRLQSTKLFRCQERRSWKKSFWNCPALIAPLINNLKTFFMDNETNTNTSLSLSVKNDVDISKLSPQELQRVDEIKKQINVEDSQAIITYGVGAQRDVSSFADTILNEVR